MNILYNIRIRIIVGLIFLSYFSSAQVIVTDPAFPTADDSVKITFDSQSGSAGLANYSGDVYAHVGVITDLSTSPSDWKYVKTNWGQNTPETKLTKVGSFAYEFTIAPDIRTYFGVPASEKILKIALVFRSAAEVGGSWLTGKNTDGSDIFVAVYEPGLQIALSKPINGFELVEFNDTLDLNLTATGADSVFLFANNVKIKSDSGNVLLDTILANQYNKLWIKGAAKDTLNNYVVDSFYYFVRKPVSIEPLPAGIKEGINYLDTHRVVLCLYAPLKSYAFVIGDFNDWQIDSGFYMKQTPDSNYFWLEISNLQSTKEYIFQYLIDGDIKVGDPYAEKVSDPWNDSYITAATYPNMLDYPKNKTSGVATVLQIKQAKYQWIDTSFVAPKQEDLIIYELLVRDFVKEHTFEAVLDSINYFKRLGINAIELMPVNEFEGNSSWGYNPNYYFAVDKYYGPKNSFKKFVDVCHQNGIAVILDVVYNHSFGTSPYVLMWWDHDNNRPASNSPFFNPIPKHDYNVGYDMNHESMVTRKYISRSLKFWLEEFKVDGFRFDLSKGFTQKNTLGNVGAWGQYDAARIHTLEAYKDTIQSVNPNAYTILEHFADNSEEKDLSGRGMMLWGNLNHSYSEAAMGYNAAGKSDFSWISYQKRGWTQAHVVGYMESHDEERLMYKCDQWGGGDGDYSTKVKSTGLLRMQLDAIFFLTIPGPKMIWQFGELGYDYSIDYNGRTGEKPIMWDYYSNANRKRVYDFYGSLSALRTQYPVFQTTNYTLDVSTEMKRIVLLDSVMNVLIIGNFDVKRGDIIPDFPAIGYWYDYFSGDSLMIKDVLKPISLAPGEYHLYTDVKLAKPNFNDTLWSPPLPEIPAGISEVYPNPTNSSFTISINTGTIAETKVEIMINDMNGAVVYEYTTTIPGQGNIHINNAHYLKSGLYFVHIIAAGYNETKKLIIFNQK
ncbi:MAG: T9SS type A sorting domain-containing protein [Bacteroidales bacterium]|nr:T9SS type A sorting domain-containing protein [Bacteroidales bacterium]